MLIFSKFLWCRSESIALHDLEGGSITIISGIYLSKQKMGRQVTLSRIAADGIISYSKGLHPNEAILILRGKTTKEKIIVEGLVIPPFASSGPYYSGFSDFHLPYDNSYVGTVHSHPSGSNRPSLEDLNRGFYASVSIIIAFPYEDTTMAAYGPGGITLELLVEPA